MNFLKESVVFFLVVFCLFLGMSNIVKSSSFGSLVKETTVTVVNVCSVKNFKVNFENNPWLSWEQLVLLNKKKENLDLNGFLRRFFGEFGVLKKKSKNFKQRCLGSGVIVNKNGYVVTNGHVVEDADEILVKLQDGREFVAFLKGYDIKTDLAFLKINGDANFPCIKLGDSKEIKIGDLVLAVGNPFGLENTVTAGIISAKKRIIGFSFYVDFIQIDASINPGNSGGALIGMDGVLLGINTAIVAEGRGLGFAIPIDLVKKVIERFSESGDVPRGWLGIYLQPLTSELFYFLESSREEGLLLVDVLEGGPAEKAGLLKGDILVCYENKNIKDMYVFSRIVAGATVGSHVEVKIVREGKLLKYFVKVGELKEEYSLYFFYINKV